MKMGNLSNKTTWILFSLVILIFIAAEFKGLFLKVPGDENVYYYMGKLITEGKLPYRDFFYAHPPFQLFIISIIIKLFGYNIVTLKLIPFLSLLIASLFLFNITKKEYENLSAIFSIILFLSSYTVLFSSVYSFGISMSLMFVAAGLYFLLNKNKCLLSGLLFGIAGITRLYALAPTLAVLITLLLKNKKDSLKFGLGFSVIFITANLLFIALFMEKYIVPVYAYHLIKTELNIPKLQIFWGIIKSNWPLAVSSLLFIFIKNKKRLFLPLLLSLTYIIFLILSKRIFDFYFIMLFFFLSIFAGYSLYIALEKIPKKILFFVIPLMLIIFLWNSIADISFLNKYSFKEFKVGKEMSDYIQNISDKKTMLFGDDSTTPLLALMTDMQIADNIVDTNEMVFVTNAVNINDIIKKISKKNIIFVVRTKQGIAQFQEFIDFLNNKCDLRRILEDEIEGEFLIYSCNVQY